VLRIFLVNKISFLKEL